MCAFGALVGEGKVDLPIGQRVALEGVLRGRVAMVRIASMGSRPLPGKGKGTGAPRSVGFGRSSDGSELPRYGGGGGLVGGARSLQCLLSSRPAPRHDGVEGLSSSSKLLAHGATTHSASVTITASPVMLGSTIERRATTRRAVDRLERESAAVPLVTSARRTSQITVRSKQGAIRVWDVTTMEVEHGARDASELTSPFAPLAGDTRDAHLVVASSGGASRR